MASALRIGLDRARGRASLYEFVKLAWPHAETVPYVDGWHIEEICLHLEAWIRREIRELAIAVPPGSSKTSLCSVLAPVWGWIQDPGTRWMYSSVDGTLSARDANRSKALIQTRWFQDRWGDIVQIDESGTRAEGSQEYYTTAGGMRFSTSVAARGVGWHVDYQIADDPIKPIEATRHTCEATWTWWSGTMASRARNPATFCRLVVQQRLRPLTPGAIDLIGHAKARGYECLILPLEYDPSRYELAEGDPRSLRRTSIGGDRRTQLGELLCPARIGPDELPRVKNRMSDDYLAQANQDPRSEQSKILARELCDKRWRVLPSNGVYTWSWDLRFSDSQSKKSSYVVGQCFWSSGVDSYLVDEKRGRWSFTESCAQAKAGAEQYRGRVLVEKKANGEALVSQMKNEIPGLELVEPRGSKEERARAIVPYISHVYLPAAGAWVEDWLAEIDRFPAEPNDRVDALSQYLADRYLGQAADYRAGLEGLVARGRGSRRTG